MNFVSFFDWILRKFVEKCNAKGLNVEMKHKVPPAARTVIGRQSSRPLIGSRLLLWLGFADDLTIPAKSLDEMRQIMNILLSLLEEYNLVMSYEKTVTMPLDMNADHSTIVESILRVRDCDLKHVTQFKYLWSTNHRQRPQNW